MSDFMYWMTQLDNIDTELWALEEQYTRAFILVPTDLVAMRNKIRGHQTVNMVINQTVVNEYWEKLEGLKRRFEGQSITLS